MFATLEKETAPEILRTNLSNVILIMKAAGIHDILNFDYLDRPSTDCLQRGLEELLALGALDRHGNLSRMGRVMAECPLIPTLSKTLLESARLSCTDSVITFFPCYQRTICSSPPLQRRESATLAKKGFLDKTGDHLTLLNIFRVYEGIPENERPRWCTTNFIDSRAIKTALDVRKQLLEFCQKHSIPTVPTHSDSDPAVLLKCLVSGVLSAGGL